LALAVAVAVAVLDADGATVGEPAVGALLPEEEAVAPPPLLFLEILLGALDGSWTQGYENS